MRLRDAVLAEVENRRGQHRTGMAFTHTLDQMVQIAHAATRHYWHIDCIGNRAGERKVIAIARSVAVHAGDEEFAST